MMSEPADNADLKAAFALQLLLTHGNAQAAAHVVSPRNIGYALFIAEYWRDDLYVLDCKRKLVEEHGEAFFLPSKYDIAHKIAKAADQALHSDEKLKALKLYAELMGFISKPEISVQSTTNIQQNRVMVLRDHGTDAEWEQQVVAQQRKLIADARG